MSSSIHSASVALRQSAISWLRMALVNHYSEHELPDIFHRNDPAAHVSDDQRKTFSTQHTYDGYLRKWILPRWRSYKLSPSKSNNG